jgi:hypothetical protein
MHGLPLKTREAAHDGGIVGVLPVAVQLAEIAEEALT